MKCKTKVSFEMDESTRKKFKMKCLEEEVTIKQVLTESISKFLEEKNHVSIPRTK